MLVISQDTSAYGVDLRYRKAKWRDTEVPDALPGPRARPRRARRLDPLHYVYPYPHVDDVIPLMAEGKVLPYLDMPFQHGSPTRAEAHEAPRARRGHARADPHLAPRLPRPHDPQHLHRRLPRRDRGRVRRAARLARRGAARPRRRVHVFAGRGRHRERRGASTWPPEVQEERLARFMERRAVDQRATPEGAGGHARNRCWSRRSTAAPRSRAAGGDAPEIDGVVRIARGGKLRVGEFARVKITGADAYDLKASLLPG